LTGSISTGRASSNSTNRLTTTSTTALVVEKADGTDVFNVDTSSQTFGRELAEYFQTGAEKYIK
jgi:predicted nuclease with TOPRIM domain